MSIFKLYTYVYNYQILLHIIPLKYKKFSELKVFPKNILLHKKEQHGLGFGFGVFNATLNNVSVISQLAVLLVEEAGIPE